MKPAEQLVMAMAAEVDAALAALADSATRIATAAPGDELAHLRQLVAEQRAYLAKRAAWGKSAAKLLGTDATQDAAAQALLPLLALLATALAAADRKQAEVFARTIEVGDLLNARVKDRAKRHDKVAKRLDALRARFSGLQKRSPGQAKREAVMRGKELIGLAAELDAVAALGADVTRSRKILDVLRRGFEALAR